MTNPFYRSTQFTTSHDGGARGDPVAARHRQARWARLPRAPINASPVPHLTSLYHDADPGNYGDRSYPGNCGGNLIRDLLLFFRPQSVFDPMRGSGTCEDVCRELDIGCTSLDLKTGHDAADPAIIASVAASAPFDFVWAHPPYWRQKVYSDHPLDMSTTPTLDAFLARYAAFIGNIAHHLHAGGHFAVLMGDYSDRDAGYVPLVYHTKRLAFEHGLVQACTDIIRFSHGASSSRRIYCSSFIPGLHDVCTVFRKPQEATVSAS